MFYLKKLRDLKGVLFKKLRDLKGVLFKKTEGFERCFI